jgi:Fe-S-cluster containining protein
MDPENVGYENAELCTRCSGACCKNSPGLTHPSDWPPTLVSALADTLDSGYYAVDWREAENDEEAIYYVRPAVVQARHYPIKEMIYHGAWGGRCVFLTDAGCELSLSQRPLSCRMMEPRKSLFGRGPEHCWAHASHKSIVRSWKEHLQAIHDAARIAQSRLESQDDEEA